MNAQRAVGFATLALLVLAALGLLGLLLWTPSTDVPPAPTPESEPVVAPVRASSRPDPQTGPMARVAVPRPVDQPLPKEPTSTTGSELNTEQWRDYNLAVDDVVRAAREQCLREWAQQEDKGRVEIIFDAVLWDGDVVDFGIRGLGEIPDHVLTCVADIAWQTPFPKHPIHGEIRLQRPIQIDGRRSLLEP